MNPQDFGSNAPGRVIQVGSGEAAYWAFAPTGLPPSLDFNPALVQALSAADRALGELAGLGRMLPNPNLLINPFIRREAVLSSRIEGTQANVADLYAYEAGQLPLPGFESPPPESDVREVLNYVHALEYGIQRLSSLPMSLRFIRELHEKLMDGVRGEHLTPGEFRRSQNWIGAPGCTLNEATYVPPPITEMPACLHALEAYIHEETSLYPPLIRTALLHYQFEAIHPFLDGNGRIGRLLITLLLVHWEILPMPLLYLSAYFEQNRQSYYDHLAAVSYSGEWEAWIRFFLDGVTQQAKDAARRAKQLQDLRESWHIRVRAQRGTGLMHDTVDFLAERPIITANAIVSKFGVTHPTAMSTLRRLAELGIVAEITGAQRNQQYLTSEILNALR